MKIENSYQPLSTGQRINSAADDPAGLSIAKSLEANTRGTSQAVENGEQTINALRTADGALQDIGDSLLRIRELAVQATNGTLSAEDRNVIQAEISNVREGIQNIVDTTSFNGRALLDGSFQNVNAANQENGQGNNISITDQSSAALGIQNFDVTGSFDISTIDAAIEQVTTTRGSIAAQNNGLLSANSSNRIASENVAAARSQIEDADFAEAISSFKQDQALQQVQLRMQQYRQANERERFSILG